MAPPRSRFAVSITLAAAALAAPAARADGVLLLRPTLLAGAESKAQVEPSAAADGSTVVTAFQVGRFRSGGAARIGFSVSTDAGRSWHGGVLPALPAPGLRVSDPSVAYDAAHRRWLVAAEIVGRGRAALVVSRSPTGSVWGRPVTVTAASARFLPYDKPWLACSDDGRCYLAYTDFARRQLSVQRSLDGGVTWSAPVGVPGAQLGVGALPVPRTGGEVVVLYRERRRIVAARSIDGGASFAGTVEVAPVRAPELPGLRVESLPAATVDAEGRIVVTWHDCRLRARCDGADIVWTRSTDGKTWSAPARVPLGAGTHVMPAVAASGRVLAITYETISRQGVDVRLVVSRDDGATWQPPRRLSRRTMKTEWFVQTDRGRMLGDYLATAIAADAAVSVYPAAAPPAPAVREAVYAARTLL